MIIVHVIKPSGTRFEYQFKDGTPDTKILAALARAKYLMGYNGTVKKTDPLSGYKDIDFGDPKSGFSYDNDETVVAVGEVDGKTFKETRRLKGPTLPPASPTPPAA